MARKSTRKSAADEAPPDALQFELRELDHGDNVALAEFQTYEKDDLFSFTPAAHGGPEVLWFNFMIERISSQGMRRPLHLAINHWTNLLGHGSPDRVQPVVAVDGGPFERLEPGRTVTLPDGQVAGAWNLPPFKRQLQVATCYPYNTPELSALLIEAGDRLEGMPIGVSQGDLPLVRVSNSFGSPGDTSRPGLYLVARQHSGETPGSWVMDGFLREILAAGDAAPLVWAVPFANMDGMMNGDYGKDNFPYDLNRAWGNPQMRHETLVITRDMNRWRERCKPVLALDFHAPGLAEVEGCYMFHASEEKQPKLHHEQVAWCRVLEAGIGPDYAAARFGRVAGYASRWETPNFTRGVMDRYGIPALTLEVPYSRIRERVLTIDDYRAIGRRMATAIMAHLAKG